MESFPERDSRPDILSAPSMRSAALFRSTCASLSMAVLAVASTCCLRVTEYLAGLDSEPLALYPQRLQPLLISTVPPSKVRLRTGVSSSPQTGHAVPMSREVLA